MVFHLVAFALTNSDLERSNRGRYLQIFSDISNSFTDICNSFTDILKYLQISLNI